MSDTEQSYTRSGARLSDLATRHLWHIQPVRDLLVIAAIVLVLWLGAKLSLVTVPLLLAILIAYLVEPIVQRVTRLSWVSRQAAAVGIIICAVLLVFVPLTFGAIFAIGQGVSAVSQLSQNVLTLDDVLKGGLDEEELDRLPGRFWQGLAVQLDEVRAAPKKAREQREKEEAEADAVLLETDPETILEIDPEAQLPDQEDADLAVVVVEADEPTETELGTTQIVEPLVPVIEAALLFDIFETIGEWARNNRGAIERRISSSGMELLQWLLRMFVSLGALIFMGFLTAFFFFFICTGWGKVRAFWFSLIPERRQGRTIELLGQMDAVIAGFVRGRLTIMLIQCVLFSVGYLIIGTPAAVILGVAVGIMAIVPYLSLIGIPISIVLMFLATDPATAETFRGQGWWMVFAPVGVYMIGQAADDYLLTPLIQGKATGLDTPTVLFASLAGAALAGFLAAGLLGGSPLVAPPAAAAFVGACLAFRTFWPAGASKT